MLTCFGVIWNYDKFSKQHTKFGKICALQKIIYIQIRLWIKIWQIGATINTTNKKSQNISLENSFLVKTFLGQKDFKKDNSSKCKVNHWLIIRHLNFGGCCMWTMNKLIAKKQDDREKTKWKNLMMFVGCYKMHINIDVFKLACLLTFYKLS
jgi:hypothetical protein